MIQNSQNDVLLVRHPAKGWELPGGMVEQGEDIIEALKREVLEETGISIAVDNLACIYSNVHNDKHFNGVDVLPTKVIFAFIGKMISGDLKKSSESPELGWFKHDQILNMIAEDSIRERASDLLNFNGAIIYKAYSTSPFSIYTSRYL